MKRVSILLLAAMAILTACTGPSKTELAEIQKGMSSLGKALVDCYHSGDEKLYGALVMPYDLAELLVNSQDLPEGAKRQEMPSKKDYKAKSMQAFELVMEESALDFANMKFQQLLPSREAVPLKGGFIVNFCRLEAIIGNEKYMQMVTVIESADHRLWLGDLSGFSDFPQN